VGKDPGRRNHLGRGRVPAQDAGYDTRNLSAALAAALPIGVKGSPERPPHLVSMSTIELSLRGRCDVRGAKDA
jgi:hypothetical protein